jgi:hypothetical protein
MPRPRSVSRMRLGHHKNRSGQGECRACLVEVSPNCLQLRSALRRSAGSCHALTARRRSKQPRPESPCCRWGAGLTARRALPTHLARSADVAVQGAAELIAGANLITATVLSTCNARRTHARTARKPNPPTRISGGVFHRSTPGRRTAASRLRDRLRGADGLGDKIAQHPLGLVLLALFYAQGMFGEKVLQGSLVFFGSIEVRDN